MRRILLAPACVLHRRPYRDSSELLEVFSRDHGRLGLVARGCRGPRSRWSGVLQPFSPLLLSWTLRGELGNLTEAEPQAPAPTLRGMALYSGFYLNELLLRLLHRFDPHPELYDAYVDAIQTLPQAADSVELQQRLRCFEVCFLSEIGYGLVLDQDCDGEAVAADVNYCYHPGLGPMPPGRHSKLGCEGLTVHGATLLGLANGRLENASQRREAMRLTRSAIDRQLGQQPLHSRQLLAELMRGRAVTAEFSGQEMTDAS